MALSGNHATRAVVQTAALTTLRAYLQARKIGQSQFARAVGSTPPVVHHWLRGTARPDPKYREAIETWTSGAVRALDWLDTEERAELEAVQPYSRTARSA